MPLKIVTAVTALTVLLLIAGCLEFQNCITLSQNTLSFVGAAPPQTLTVDVAPGATYEITRDLSQNASIPDWLLIDGVHRSSGTTLSDFEDSPDGTARRTRVEFRVRRLPDTPLGLNQAFLLVQATTPGANCFVESLGINFEVTESTPVVALTADPEELIFNPSVTMRTLIIRNSGEQPITFTPVIREFAGGSVLTPPFLSIDPDGETTLSDMISFTVTVTDPDIFKGAAAGADFTGVIHMDATEEIHDVNVPWHVVRNDPVDPGLFSVSPNTIELGNADPDAEVTLAAPFLTPMEFLATSSLPGLTATPSMGTFAGSQVVLIQAPAFPVPANTAEIRFRIDALPVEAVLRVNFNPDDVSAFSGFAPPSIGTSDQFSFQGTGIIADAAGGPVIVGTAFPNFGADDDTGFLMQADPSGFVRQFDVPIVRPIETQDRQDIRVHGAFASANGYVVFGHFLSGGGFEPFTNRGFVYETDFDGNRLWAAAPEPPSGQFDLYNDVIPDSDGFIAVGHTRPSGVFNRTGFIESLDSGGVRQWRLELNVPGAGDQFTAIRVLEGANGGLAILAHDVTPARGYFIATRPIIGDPPGQQEIDVVVSSEADIDYNDFTRLANGNIAIVGFDGRDFDGSTYPLYLAEVDATGNVLAEHIFTESFIGRGICQADSGEWVVSGQRSLSGDASIGILDPENPATLARRTFTFGALSDGLVAAGIAENGDIIATGSGVFSGDRRVIVVRTSVADILGAR